MIKVAWWDLEHRRGGPPPTSLIGVDLVQVLSLDRKSLSPFAVVIAEAHDLQDGGIRESLLSLLESPGRPPVLLLTSAAPDNIRVLPGLSVDDLAWTLEGEEEALARGMRLGRVLLRTRLGESLVRSEGLCTCVRSAVKRVFLDPDSISTVQELARACFVCPRTLERRWNASRPRGCWLTLKALVDWVLLLRARELGQQGLSRRKIAKALDIHTHTLRRISFRLTGLTCQEALST